MGDKGSFERLFGNDIARVIDHFLIFRDFSYTIKELGHELRMGIDELKPIVKLLMEKEIIMPVTFDNTIVYRFKPNELTRALRVAQYNLASIDIERELK